MAVPSEATYSTTVLDDAHQAVIDRLDAGTGNAVINIRDASDVLLAQIDLNDPCGTLHATTKQLTFSISGPDTSANASGTAAYGEFADSDGNVHLSLPTQEGASAVSGYLVLNSETIVVSTQVTVASATIG